MSIIKSLHKVSLICSLLALFITSLLTAIWQTNVQMSNADQLIDPILFNSGTALNEIILPGAHTFFLKWPLFLLSGIAGRNSIYIFTVLIYLLTIFTLIFFCHIIAKNALKLGNNSERDNNANSKITKKAFAICISNPRYCYSQSAIYLIIMSVLIFVPAQVEIGQIVPLGFAMLTTRNIEYIIFTWTLWIIVNKCSKEFYKRNKLLNTLLFSLVFVLVTSDRLFIALYFGSFAFLIIINTIIVYLKKSDNAARFTLISLVKSAVICFTAIVLSFLLVLMLDGLHLFYFPVEGGNPALPYNFENDGSKILNGFLSGIVGVFQVLGGISLINILIILLAIVFYAVFWVNNVKNKENSPFSMLINAFFGAGFVSFASFFITNHLYAQDARYLSIFFFGVVFLYLYVFLEYEKFFNPIRYFIDKKLKNGGLISLVVVICILITNIGFGLCWQYNTDSAQNEFYSYRIAKDEKVLRIMNSYALPKVLVGDYWRVTNVASYDSNIIPIGVNDCKGSRRGNLTTLKWRMFDYNNYSFTYLLPLDNSQLEGYYQCNREEIIDTFGIPNQEIIVEGDDLDRKEVLFVYSHTQDVDRAKVG